MIWKNNISFFKMVSFLVFVLVSLFIYDWKAHIVFPLLLKNLHLPFLCSSTVSLSFVIYFLFFSVYRSSTTLLLPLLTNFRLLHSVLYEEQFFICDLFSFLKDIFALDFRLKNYGVVKIFWQLAFYGCYHLAKAHETNLTSWALVQKSSGQVRFSRQHFWQQCTLDLSHGHFLSLDWCCQCISSSLFSFVYLTIRSKGKKLKGKRCLLLQLQRTL